MQPLAYPLIALALSSLTPLSAQDVLYYKFDDLCGTGVINFAASSPAAAEGTITSTLPGAPTSSAVPGRFGLALAPGDLSLSTPTYNYVDAGWNPGTVTGSLTFALWIHAPAGAPVPSLTYLFGASNNFRCFVNNAGSTVGKMQLGGWGGTNLVTANDVRTPAYSGWEHVACVIDAAAGTGTWYVNGIADPPIVLSAPMNWTATSFFVGKYYFTSTPSMFEIDEFLLTARALSPAEIGLLAAAPRGAAATYGAGGCGNLSLGSNGVPTLGNTSYGLTLDSAYGAAFSIGVGASRCTLGPIALPFDLGTILPGASGCLLEASQELATASGGKPPGPITLPLPIASAPALAGITVYFQSAGLDVNGPTFVLSNALAVSLGY